MPGEGRIEKRSPGRRILNARFLAIAGAVVIGDQITKFLAIKKLPLGSSLPVIKDIFHLTIVLNKGAAFGILKNQNLLFIISGIIVALFILVYIPRVKGENIFLKTACALILGGIAGNLIDRLRFGYVVDFLDFRVWPVFNAADSCITVGAFLCILYYLKSGR